MHDDVTEDRGLKELFTDRIRSILARKSSSAEHQRYLTGG
jgi:hypothetical protein